MAEVAPDEITDKVINAMESSLNSNASENKISKKKIQISQPNMQDIIDACKNDRLF